MKAIHLYIVILVLVVCTNKSKAEIKDRALLVAPTYVGPEKDYLYNMNWVLENFFKNTSN